MSCLTLSPAATIELFISTADVPVEDVADGAVPVVCGGTQPGFHSVPVAVLYSAFNANKLFTAASIASFGNDKKITVKDLLSL